MSNETFMKTYVHFLESFFKNVFKIEGIIPISLLILVMSYYTSSSVNASSLINTVIQSLSTILAIVLSLTLVAVELSSQTYSARILKKFVSFKNNDFWILLGFYSFSIIYSLFLLNSIYNSVSSLGKLGISFCILFAIWSLILLPKYFMSTVENLGPRMVIGSLSEDIDENFIKKLEKSDFKLNSYPLSVLIDIIIGSIKKGDSETVEMVLNQLEPKLIDLIENDVVKDYDKLLKYILYDMEKIKNTAILQSDMKTVRLIISYLNHVGTSIIVKSFSYQFIELEDYLFEFMGDLSKIIIKTDSKYEAMLLINFFKDFPDNFWPGSINYKKSMFYLNKMMILSIEKMESENYLNLAWIESFDENYYPIEAYLRRVLFDLKEKIGKEGLLLPIKSETKFLTNFGIHALDHYPNQIFKIIRGLEMLFDNFFNEGYKETLSRPTLLDGGDEDEIYHILINIINSLEIIGIKSIEKNVYNHKISHYDDIHSLKKGTIIRLDYIILEKIMEVLKKIGINCLTKNNPINVQFNKNNREECINKLVEKVIDSFTMIGSGLLRKESDLFPQVIFTIGILSKSFKKEDFNHDTSVYGLKSLESCSYDLIERNSAHLNELLRIMGEIGVYGIEMDDASILDDALLCLTHINSNLTDYNDIMQVFTTLRNMSIELIEMNHIEHSNSCISKMESIIEELDKKGFSKRDIDNFQNELERIGEVSKKY